MIAVVGLIVGAGLGALNAKRRGGTRADMAQYAAAHGIAFGLLGLFLTLLLGRVL